MRAVPGLAPSPCSGSSQSAGSVHVSRRPPTGAQPPGQASSPTLCAHTPSPEGALSPHATLGLINHNSHKEILQPRDARGDRKTVRTTPKQPPKLHAHTRSQTQKPAPGNLLGTLLGATKSLIFTRLCCWALSPCCCKPAKPSKFYKFFHSKLPGFTTGVDACLFRVNEYSEIPHRVGRLHFLPRCIPSAAWHKGGLWTCLLNSGRRVSGTQELLCTLAGSPAEVTGGRDR